MKIAETCGPVSMTIMKLFHSHDYIAGNRVFDEVFHIVHKKIQMYMMFITA